MNIKKNIIQEYIAPEDIARDLENYFLNYDHAIIAYSGGVDSALLAYVAHRVLNEKMIAALADSPSLARREYRFAKKFAQDHDIPLEIVQTGEMEDPFYQANQGDRCYHCKKALFDKLAELQQQLEGSLSTSSWPIFYGVNQDDLGDHRPGIQAGQEASILAPYVELGINKRMIRSVSAYYGLEIADKPAMPCLSSRILYGESVTEEKLSQVETAEDFLYDLGFQVLRVRHHGDTARIEIPVQDYALILENREKVINRFHELGFVYVSLDLDGFRSGSLNAVLT